MEGQCLNGSLSMPIITKTPSINRLLLFLNDCNEGEEIDEVEMQDLKEFLVAHKANNSQMWHLVLCASLKDEDFQKLICSSENELISYLDDLTELEFNSMDKEKYWLLVVGLDLIEECICMVMANPSLQIMEKTTEVIVNLITQNHTQLVKNWEVYDFLLVNLVKLSRISDKQTREHYLKCFETLITYAIHSSSLEIHLKLSIIFRLAGISMLEVTDYNKCDEEIGKLLTEWTFDANFSTRLKSIGIYEALFGTSSKSWIQKDFVFEILCFLDTLLLEIPNEVSQVTGLDVEHNLLKMPWLDYIGGCAYLTDIIIQKYEERISRGNIPKLLQCIKSWSNYKPKMKEEDFKGEVDFFEFCARMKKHGELDIYKRDWQKKFLSFSPENIFLTPEGFAIAEKFIIIADFDTVLEYVKLAHAFGSVILPETIKVLISNVFKLNPVVFENRVKFVNAMFCSGVTTTFCTSENNINLNSYLIKDIDPNSEQDAMMLCFQDPLTVVSGLLQQSVRYEDFRRLEFAKPFFHLPFSNESYGKDTVILKSFKNLLKGVAYMTSSYENLVKSFDELKKLVNVYDMFVCMKSQILVLLQERIVNLDKVYAICCVLEKLIENIVKIYTVKGSEDESPENKVVLETVKFFEQINRFFYMYSNSKTLYHVMNIRNTLVATLKLIKGCVEEESSSEEVDDKLLDLNLHDLGILYVRRKKLRKQIENILTTEKDLTEDLDSKSLINYCVKLVLNSCENEWSDLLRFVFEVLLKSIPRFISINKVHILNDCLLATYFISLEMKLWNVFLHFFKFYQSGLDFLTDKGKINKKSTYENLEFIIMVCFVMSEGKTRTTSRNSGLYNVLLYLMDQIKLFVSNEHISEQRCKLYEKIKQLPKMDSQCEPMMLMIISVLQDEKSIVP